MNNQEELTSFKPNASNPILSLQIGDVVWAKRYNNEEEKQQIEDSHRQGPFIIIAKEGDQYYGLYCTSVEHPNHSLYLYFPLEYFDHQFPKNSYAKLNQLYQITPYHYLKTIGHITNDNLNKLNKLLFILSRDNPRFQNKITNQITYTLDVGDTIKLNDHLYYIYHKDSDNFYCHIMSFTNKHQFHLTIYNQNYVINFQAITQIPIDNRYRLMATTSYFQMKHFDALDNQANKNHQLLDTPCRGQLVQIEESLYYIYGEQGNNFQCIKVYNSDQYRQKKTEITIPDTGCYIDFKVITIQKGEYYTKFEEVIIPKTTSMIGKRMATDFEIESIKKVRKSFKKENQSHPKKPSQTFPPRFSTGTIIIDQETITSYLIIKKNTDYLTLLNLNNYTTFEYTNQMYNQNPFQFYRRTTPIEYREYLTQKKNSPKTLKRV